MESLLFIYGTLRRSGSAHHLMQGAEFLGLGTIKGRLVHVNQYPGLIIDSESEVKGELYSANDKLISELDRYEGCLESPPLYSAEIVKVWLEDSEASRARAYVFQQLRSHHEPIESGDWIEWVKHKNS